MSSIRRISAFLLVPLLALVLTSCGDDEPRLTKAAFTTKVSALCKERDKKTEFLDEENIFNMKTGQTVWPKAKTVIVDYIDDVSDLNPPKDFDAKFDDYLDAADAVSENVDDVIDAAEDEEQKAYSQQIGALFEKFGVIDKPLGDYGVKDCYDADEAFPTSQKPAAGATTVEIGAKEYAFDIPTGIKAGKTAFKLVNNGNELHIFGFGRLKEGVTFEQVKAAFENENEEDPGLTEDDNISGIAVPDGSTTANAELKAGTYVAYCFIPAPDGTPHLAKGMLAEFEVS